MVKQMSKEKKDTMITLSKLKSEYGLTDKLIKEFFSEPDKLVENPYYRSAAPMKLYDEKRVKRVIKTKKYMKALNEAASRKEAAAKAVKTKTDKTMEETRRKIEDIKVKVLHISDEKLREKAVKSYNDFHYDILYGDERFINFISGEYADDLTKDRWTVNYIRHELTDYDHDLYNMKGSVGKSEAYVMYKEAVLNKIADAYPKYREECDRQIKKFKEEHEMFLAYKRESA